MYLRFLAKFIFFTKFLFIWPKLFNSATDEEDGRFCDDYVYTDLGSPLICVESNEPVLTGIATNITRSCDTPMMFTPVDTEWIDDVTS